MFKLKYFYYTEKEIQYTYSEFLYRLFSKEDEGTIHFFFFFNKVKRNVGKVRKTKYKKQKFLKN